MRDAFLQSLFSIRDFLAPNNFLASNNFSAFNNFLASNSFLAQKNQFHEKIPRAKICFYTKNILAHPKKKGVR